MVASRVGYTPSTSFLPMEFLCTTRISSSARIIDGLEDRISCQINSSLPAPPHYKRAPNAGVCAKHRGLCGHPTGAEGQDRRERTFVEKRAEEIERDQDVYAAVEFLSTQALRVFGKSTER